MKDYCNRAERNELLFLFGFRAQCTTAPERLKSVLTPQEGERIGRLGDEMEQVLVGVLQRIKGGSRALGAQLERESRVAQMQLYVPGSNYMESAGDCVKLDKRLARQLAEWTAGQCTGCDGVDDCPLRTLRDMLGEPPVNAQSEVCQYRIDADELIQFDDEEVAGD